MNISGQASVTRSLFILMTALCVLFLVTVTPVSVGMVYLPYQREKNFALASVDPDTALYDAQYFKFFYSVAYLVSFFNSTFNFAIYVFSGSKFRAELMSMLCCKAN
ncbi:hypothetical protein DPMN_170198 [Dreissena polymorpha]|uniref:G-protein coupled receptors family 1 profile domain-containing protein n=2 Tax=Dreissena polymorpha TaxID=45954 RepID=A0A9D4DZC6_DREPO|nr:hypothetical protein DPMN_070421 [Dreissena polymorpha]KAH3768977.1 hypothetical protein DPMN_170198 [Dreissena polymorpha]